MLTRLAVRNVVKGRIDSTRFLKQNKSWKYKTANTGETFIEK